MRRKTYKMRRCPRLTGKPASAGKGKINEYSEQKQQEEEAAGAVLVEPGDRGGDFDGDFDRQWESFRLLHPCVVLIEQELADKYISQPLYSRLRQNYLHNCFSLLENDLITQLRAIEISLQKGQQLNMAVITSLVNFIRNNPDDFPEWQESDTARRYEQTSFQNKKHAAGYWW